MHHDSKFLGRAAETMAAELYQKSKFEILAQNYRFGAYEIDLIAKRGHFVHLVEVKYRKTLHDANLALNQSQFHRIAEAGEFFMQGREEFMQIDALLIDHRLQWERIANIMLN